MVPNVAATVAVAPAAATIALRIAPTDVIAQEEEVRLQERRAKEKLEDLVVKLILVNYSDVQSMQALVKRLLTPRGSVNIDERTSTLIVKDIASVIEESSALVAAVDTEERARRHPRLAVVVVGELLD